MHPVARVEQWANAGEPGPAAALTAQVAGYAGGLRQHPVVQLAWGGELSPRLAAAYRGNLHFLGARTRHQLGIASRRSAARDAALAEFFDSCSRAVSLVADSDASTALLFEGASARELADLVHALDRSLAHDPRLYLAHALLVVALFPVIAPPVGTSVHLSPVSGARVIGGPAARLEPFTRSGPAVAALITGDPVPHFDVLHRSMRHLDRCFDQLASSEH